MYKLLKIEPSEKKGKKWNAVFHDNTTDKYKTISFGASGYRDYTLIHALDPDEAKKVRARYWKRHIKDLDQDPMSAGYLSLFVLWGKFPSVEKNMNWYKKLFGF